MGVESMGVGAGIEGGEMTPLATKVAELLVHDPDGSPLAPETIALLKAAVKAEEEDGLLAVKIVAITHGRDSIVSAFQCVESGAALDGIVRATAPDPTDPMRQTMRKAIRWLATHPESEWPIEMR